ncbi:hypothetical protein [Bradyrhizobium sp. 17]|uniref:hypothetical protein n=1 Tax=Bradyrhizobium sp. 17 TaxID=2782649 RepID=UPI001FF9214D|nr:hypothetical protein [Bradyrhizobium sp. 17]MCK1520958.1 hypothetical protein [Bradyrhizobium sp. 17]
MQHSIIVRGESRVIDRLRAEASRVARAEKIVWWAEKESAGTRFCFESKKCLEPFRAACEAMGVETA